jgi:hypothetical protein
MHNFFHNLFGSSQVEAFVAGQTGQRLPITGGSPLFSITTANLKLPEHVLENRSPAGPSLGFSARGKTQLPNGKHSLRPYLCGYEQMCKDAGLQSASPPCLRQKLPGAAVFS